MHFANAGYVPDRQLQVIPPKGRPISQCNHCRSQRRNKSAHVKCDCGEKTAKCPHLEPKIEGHQSTCCCHHGAPCTCCHKKARAQPESLPDTDAGYHSDAKPAKPTRRRRSKANNQISEAALTFDEHGHHKPTYKHNKASQNSGPYQLHRAHSTQSSGSISNRSLESLSIESFGNAFSTDGVIGVSQMPDQRLTKSETASPMLSGSSSVPPVGMPAALAPIQTNLQPLWAQTWGSASGLPDPLFSAAEEQEPIVSAGISPSGDFNLYGWPTFDPSSYNFLDLPALTSGEGSENEAFDNETDDFMSPGIGLTPFGSLSRTNTSSSVFSLDRPVDFTTGEMVDILGNDDTGKYYESAVATTLEQIDTAFNAQPPPPSAPGILDEQFSQWMEINSDPQPNIPTWDPAS